MRFLPTHFWIAAAFPILFSLNWAIADDIPFRDIRVMLAYVTVIVAVIVWLAGTPLEGPAGHSRGRAADPRLRGGVLSRLAQAVRHLSLHRRCWRCWGRCSSPSPSACCRSRAASSSSPWPILFLATAATTHVEYIERSPISDPFVQADVPKIAHPEKAMVLMTGNGPLGFIAPSFPHNIPLLRIDGWMVQPQDGTQHHQDDEEPRRRATWPTAAISTCSPTPTTWAGPATRWSSTACASTG